MRQPLRFIQTILSIEGNVKCTTTIELFILDLSLTQCLLFKSRRRALAIFSRRYFPYPIVIRCAFYFICFELFFSIEFVLSLDVHSNILHAANDLTTHVKHTVTLYDDDQSQKYLYRKYIESIQTFNRLISWKSKPTNQNVDEQITDLHPLHIHVFWH